MATGRLPAAAHLAYVGGAIFGAIGGSQLGLFWGVVVTLFGWFSADIYRRRCG